MVSIPRFEVFEGWEQLPPGYVHRDVDGVATDSRDRVYLLTRGDARVNLERGLERCSPGATGRARRSPSPRLPST